MKTEELYCPFCGAPGIKLWSDKAQSGKSRYRCKSCKGRTTRPLSEPPQILPKCSREKAKRYIITSAQNNTDLVSGAFATYKVVAEHLGARLMAIATVHRNPTLYDRGLQESQRWPAEVLPYICNERFRINKNLVIRGDAKLSHTAINPLTGANHAGNMVSEIFGHAQLAMELVPTPRDSMPKGLYTTGTISKPNYGDSFYAKKAAFHHNVCALLIEVEGDRFWISQLQYDGEGVQLLHNYYTPDGVTTRGIAGISYGDIHADVLHAGPRARILSLMRALRPDFNVLHDLFDAHSCSHHTEKNVLHNLRHARPDIRGELDRTLDFLREVPDTRVIVNSNHNDHLDQWFNRFKPQNDRINLDIYYELGELARKNKDGGLFELYVKSRGVECLFTSPNKEFDIAGIDHSQHGHRGPNGTKGSTKAFAKTGRKTTKNHDHTPRIEKGCWGAGVADPDHDYAQGYSSWQVAHVAAYPSGKRTMITEVHGKYSPLVREMIRASQVAANDDDYGAELEQTA